MDRAARAAVIKATQNPGHLEMGDDFWISGYDGPIVTYCREPGHEDTAIKDLYLSVG